MGLNRREAEQLWGDLRSFLVNAASVIDRIIAEKAWKPLGYATFSAAWSEQMANLTLAKEIRPQVVYQMLSEGLTVDEISDLVKGVGPERAASLARQRSNGVPADHAVVHEHLRRKPRTPDTIHVKVGSTMLIEYRRIAADSGTTVEGVAKAAIADAFSQLVAEKACRRPA